MHFDWLSMAIGFLLGFALCAIGMVAAAKAIIRRISLRALCDPHWEHSITWSEEHYRFTLTINAQGIDAKAELFGLTVFQMHEPLPGSSDVS